MSALKHGPKNLLKMAKNFVFNQISEMNFFIIIHEHPFRRNCGQNIYKASIEGRQSFTTKEDLIEFGENAVKEWYSQIDNYNFDTHDKKELNGGEINSFTQVVWKGATHVGVGISPTQDGKFVYGTRSIFKNYPLKII